MIEVEIIECLEDNFAYLLKNSFNNKAVLIDVPEAEPIQRVLNKPGVELEAVLITHHHHDHIQGLEGLDIGDAKIIGAAQDRHRLPPLDQEVRPGDRIEIAEIGFEVYGADGHTIGQIAYYVEAMASIFTADSLMIWGCGRLFEGTPEQMWETFSNFAKLPPRTLVYSGHDYALTNGRFALSLRGFEERMQSRLDKIEAQKASGQPIMPVYLEEEINTNPFMLAANDDYARALGIEDKDVPERFAYIRALRDKF